MHDVKVSVVVPIYNVKAYIDECIVSILRQSLDSIDIILVDDGSTDGSSDICDDYADKYSNIRVIHKSNGGLGSARNIGLSHAIGEYVYFIDGDDSLTHRALERLYYEAENNSIDVILFSAQCFVDEIGIQYNVNQYKRTICLDEPMLGKELFLKLKKGKEYYPSIPLRFYRTEYLQSRKYVFPEHIIHEDEIYGFLSLIQANRAECISDKLYYRRYRCGSIMTSKKLYASAFGYAYTWQAIMDYYPLLKGWTESEKNIYIDFAFGFLKKVIRCYSMDDECEDKIKEILNKHIKDERYNVGRPLISKKNRMLFDFPYVYHILRKTYNVARSFKHALQMPRRYFSFFYAVAMLKFYHCIHKDCCVLIGTPTHGNLGDQAIVYAERKFLQGFNSRTKVIEFSSTDYLNHAEFIQKHIYNQDRIIIDGGGSMGTLWVHNEYRFRDVVERFPKNEVYIFPQTVYYADDVWGENVLKDSVDIFSKHPRLKIFCREKNSFKFVQEKFPSNKSYYIPDMVLSLYPHKMDVSREENVLLCLREDLERVVSQAERQDLESFLRQAGLKVKCTSTLVQSYVDMWTRNHSLNIKWKEFSRSSLVITDRLHAMIFCVITGTPCIAMDNLSKKVSGTYEWIKDLEYVKLVYSIQDINLTLINELRNKADNFYTCDFENRYEKMRKIILDEKI